MIAATGVMLKKAFPMPVYRELVESVLGFHIRDVASSAAAGDLFVASGARAKRARLTGPATLVGGAAAAPTGAEPSASSSLAAEPTGAERGEEQPPPEEGGAMVPAHPF
eukprot:457703-Lingulodinium_polyedra.AAC.1